MHHFGKSGGGQSEASKPDAVQADRYSERENVPVVQDVCDVRLSDDVQNRQKHSKTDDSLRVSVVYYDVRQMRFDIL